MLWELPKKWQKDKKQKTTKKKKNSIWSSICGAQQLVNPTSIHKNKSSIPGLAQWVKRFGIAVSCGVGCRHGLDPALLWLWHKPVSTAPIRPLAWEPPYAAGEDQEMAKRQKKKKKRMWKSTCSEGLRRGRGQEEDHTADTCEGPGRGLANFIQLKKL